MKLLALFAAVLFLAVAPFAFGGESCGCKVTIENIHSHNGNTCGHEEGHSDEVMVGHDTEAGVVTCGTVVCHCACPAKKDE